MNHDELLDNIDELRSHLAMVSTRVDNVVDSLITSGMIKDEVFKLRYGYYYKTVEDTYWKRLVNYGWTIDMENKRYVLQCPTCNSEISMARWEKMFHHKSESIEAVLDRASGLYTYHKNHGCKGEQSE